MILHKKFSIEEVLEGFLYSILIREMSEDADCEMTAEFDDDGNVDVYIDNENSKEDNPDTLSN